MSTDMPGLLEMAARRGNVGEVTQILRRCEDGGGRSLLNFTFEQEDEGLGGAQGVPGTLLHWAVIKGDVDLATLLLAKNADVDALDKRQQTPLFPAAALTPRAARYTDPLAMVALLLKHKAQVCPRRANGSTAVHAAMTLGGHREVLELLVKQDPRALYVKDRRDGNTPLDDAVSRGLHGHAEFLRSLMQRGADV